MASDEGHLEIVRDLLNHNEVEVNIQDNEGNTALIYARDLEIVRILLNHTEIDVNIKNVTHKKKKDDVALLLKEHKEVKNCCEDEERTYHDDAERTHALEDKRRR